MEKVNYPLLYYQLNEHAVLGLLVGTNYQLVDNNVSLIKQACQEYLQKIYKKHDYYPYSEILEPRLKVFKIKIRPTYRERNGAFPTAETIEVPVPVVYGETDQGDYEAHLPLFNESFYYYDQRQFKSLVNHFAADLLNRMQPADLYKYMLDPQPELDTLSLRVNLDRKRRRSPVKETETYENLNRLAVRYPFPKAIRKQRSAAPEAAWELDDKVNEVMDKLVNMRANLLIVGNPGVGKSAVLMQAIRRISNQSRKLNFQLTFWQIMAQRITASARYLGEWQETCEKLIEELRLANGILWIVDLIRLLQSGGEGPEDSVAAFLLSFLQQGKLQIVGEVTEQELESIRRLLPGFAETFQVIKLEELPQNKVQSILDKFAEYARTNHQMQILPEALNLAYRLLLRYFPYESFPGKGIKFLGHCISEAQLSEKDTVDKAAVIQNFVQQTGMPELFLRDDLLLDSQELQDYFAQRIIGQPRAIEQMLSIVKVFKAGLNNPGKPISTLVFAGPTGVGKTASAKVLADYFFGKGQKRSPLIRIDMSEFQHPGQINRFIGAGREVGKLVQDIRDRPFAVLLLDEVEKAAPTIFDALMTVLDEGMLVDAYGRVTNFRNTIIIMTTNLGASNRASIGYRETDDPSARYLSAINSFFRPEFVNRIDNVVFFNSLNEEDIYKITLKELTGLRQREGFIKRGLQLHFSEALTQHLASTGFDERYGARPLQRAIEQTVVNPLAHWLLEHPEAIDCALQVDYDNGALQVSIQKR